jgi:methyltransferase family protein
MRVYGVAYDHDRTPEVDRGPDGHLVVGNGQLGDGQLVLGDSDLQTEVLESLSDARNYRRWLADLARPYLGAHPIEIGSGTGDYALEWVGGAAGVAGADGVPEVQTFTATEADPARFAALCRRFGDHPVIRPDHLLLPAGARARAGAHTAAVALNVLEHIPDDVAALRAMATMVGPGGAVVLIVPAFPSAMSRFDLAVGHQRRYTRASLQAAMSAARLVPERVRYVNPIGLINWYVSAKALRMTPRNGIPLRIYDRTAVPVARVLDRIPSPFGQSVFAVGRVA